MFVSRSVFVKILRSAPDEPVYPRSNGRDHYLQGDEGKSDSLHHPHHHQVFPNKKKSSFLLDKKIEVTGNSNANMRSSFFLFNSKEEILIAVETF